MVTVELLNLGIGQAEALDALVDSGSTYTFIPRPVLGRIGVDVVGQHPFRLANEERVFYDVGWARVRLEDSEAITLVVFGDPNAMPLLGAHALEGLGLAVDPVNQRLIPVDALLN